MAITLVPENGTGMATANSYLSAAEADALLELNPTMYTIWLSFSESKKESLLVWASTYIDTHIDWFGYKAVADSGLRWPRHSVVDLDGISVSTTLIPTQLKRAVAQLAIFLNASDAAATGGESSNIPEGIKRVRADVVEVEFFDGASADSQSGSDLLPVNMRFLIRGLGEITTGRRRIANVVR